MKKLDTDSSGTSFLILLLGGLLPALFHASATAGKVVCTTCGYAFTPPSGIPAKKSLLITVGLLCLAAILILGLYYVNK
jgi:hypothetical protein